MVTDSRKTPGASACQPINAPEPVVVEEDPQGLPIVLRMLHQQRVTIIEDQWRIDDEWWRKEPVSRLYFSIRLDSGQHFTIYHDLISGNWFRQSY